MISLLKIQLCGVGLSYFGSDSLFGNGESRDISQITFSDLVIFSFDSFLLILSTPKNKIEHWELTVKYDLKFYFFSSSFLFCSLFLLLYDKKKKNQNYWTALKFGKHFTREKFLFKVKEGVKVLEIKEETEPPNKLWNPTTCVRVFSRQRTRRGLTWKRC